jgi:hypothetical protein
LVLVSPALQLAWILRFRQQPDRRLGRAYPRSCELGASVGSEFSIAGPSTEWLVLGSAAIHYEGKLMWDNAKMEFTNNKDATKWIKPAYRKGWEVKL